MIQDLNNASNRKMPEYIHEHECLLNGARNLNIEYLALKAEPPAVAAL